MDGAEGTVKGAIDLVFWEETRKKTWVSKKGQSILPIMRYLRKDELKLIQRLA